MKKIAVISLALLLGACAHKPELAGTPPAAVKTVKPAVKTAAPVSEAKPATFKKRWFPKFKIKWVN